MTEQANPVLEDFPNPASNVFLMTRFRDTKHHKDIENALTKVLAEYSLNRIRADKKQYLPELWSNVRACIQASGYGIAVVEQIDERGLNPNMCIELGYMLGQQRRCVLLKEQRAELPVDLLGHLHREFDVLDIAPTVTSAVHGWLVELGIAKQEDERMLVYVSEGGTCRCAMAKAITRKLLQTRKVGYPLRVESMARGEPTLAGASDGARAAIADLLGEDLLADHRSARLTKTRKAEADLILAMSEGLARQLPPEKTHVLKPYLGSEGDVADPYPYHDTPEGPAKYAACAVELEAVIEPGLDKIIEELRPD